MMRRIMNFQPIAWFWDLYQRGLLEMDPPYQRRSIWNQSFKDYFIDTVLQGYPAPSIFLYQNITPMGVQKYSVVDGKQRLTAIFDFAQNMYPVSDTATISLARGKYFKDLDDDIKSDFWQYQFGVEYVPTDDEELINNIFDRINRNVAKLSRQELRHARLGGEFISTAEELVERLAQYLPTNFPRISTQSRKQMKDVEFIAQLLLLIEEGPKSYSQDDLDRAFSERDASWDLREEVVVRFEKILALLKSLVEVDASGSSLRNSRFANQADFYSLFGALDESVQNKTNIDVDRGSRNLLTFMETVENPEKRAKSAEAGEYYEAARSASNDAGPRRIRVDTIRSVIADGDGTK